MTDRELEQRIRAWYASQVRDTESAPGELRASVAAIPATVPAPLHPLRRRRDLGLLAVAAVLLLGGALAAGSAIVRFTRVPPGPSDAAELVTPVPAPSPTPLPTANLRPGSLIAYARWAGTVSRLWVAAEGGRDAHELFPGGAADQYGRLAWSPDGSRLLYSEGRELFLADVDGGEPERIDTGCVAPCDVDTDATFSSDGTYLAFVRQTRDANEQVESAAIVTLEVASGRVALLSSTVSDAGSWPSWSPDGQRIVYSTYGEGDRLALVVVDRDGGNLHQISPPALDAGSPDWSPDGSRIVFTSGGGIGKDKDIYTIRPDGTDLHRLTSDGLSSSASWTADGRILFAKKAVDAGGIGGVSFWTMDADGTNATVLVPANAVGVGDDQFPPVRVVPQPLGGPAIAPIVRAGGPAIAVGPPAATPTPPDLAPGFSWTGSMDAAEFSPLGVTATPLADGRVLFVGSCDTRVQLYDPGTGTFAETGSLTVVRGGTTATLLRDGRVLVAGGYACAGGDTTWASAELYDPTTGTFSTTGSMAAPRSQHTATLLGDGRVLIAGGLTESSATTGGITLVSYQTVATDSNVATAEIYDPRTGTFSKTDSMSTPHRGHTATLLGDGRVLVVGNGGESSPPGRAADLYDPVTGTFTRTGSLKSGRSDHSATLLADGRVLILGGDTVDDPASVSAELYDPVKGTFAPAGKMADGRSHHGVTRLSDGRVLIVGGYWNDGQGAGVLSSAELFDPDTGSFSAIGSIGFPRAGATATLLRDGRVLIAGGHDIGRNGGKAVPSAVLYQP